jgi:CRP/FNR family transcriptional regulator, cyclic AMP receptor protein
MKKPHKTVEDFLRSTTWMSQLAEATKKRVVSEAFDQFHERNGLVARRGEQVDSWIGVAAGFLKVVSHHQSGKVVMFSGIPTDAFVGEGSVIKREPRRYDIVAMTPSRTVHVPRATFRWLLETSFEFNHFIIAHLNERLGQFMAMVETDRLTEPAARLARAVCGLFNPVLYPGVGPLLKASQEELGDLAGLSRQTVNIALHELESEGLLKIAYGGILVQDLAALRKRAEFN